MEAITGPAFLAFAGAVLAGAFIQGTGGIGFAMFAAPVAALVKPELVPGPMLMLGGEVSLLVALRERASIDFRGAGFALAGRVPGSVVAGFGSGLMGTITSVGAPPIGIVMQNEAPARVRSTVGAFLFVGALVSVSVLAWAGRFGAREAGLGALMLLPMALGFRLSSAMVRRLDARIVRRVVRGVSTVSATVLIAQNL